MQPDHPAPDLQREHPPAARDPDLGLHDPLADSFPRIAARRLLFWIAVVFSAFQIATAAHVIDLPSQIVRAVHVGFLTLLTFPLLALARQRSRAAMALAWVLALAGVAVAAYQWVEYAPLLLRAGNPNTLDLVMGVVALVTVFAAAWAMMGPGLADHRGHLPGVLLFRPVRTGPVADAWL